MSDHKRIQDNRSLRKMQHDAQALRAIKAVFPVARPLLNLLKVDTDSMAEALHQADDLTRQMNELVLLPDKFNGHFASRGWIAHDLLNVDLMRATIEKAEAGAINEAELDLVAYYSPETVEALLRAMWGVEAFRIRMPLAHKALDDYRDGRYHASVPVVLALLDGMVNDVHEKHRGFFAENTDLTAWDSIAGHSTGLNALANLFKQGRQKTTTTPLTVPYRHGILHGMDLGYDNKMVAAKTWAALFATKEWAQKAERGQLNAQPEPPAPTLAEIGQKLLNNKAMRDALDAWRPRDIAVGVDILATGSPDQFSPNSPEMKLSEFLGAWAKNNYGVMASCLAQFIGYAPNVAPARVREVYGGCNLLAFAFQAVNDEAPAVTLIDTYLLYVRNGEQIEHNIRFRLMYEGIDNEPSSRTVPGGKWGIVN
jgi:hypothetical protein